MGPIDELSQIHLLKRYPEKTWNDFFVDYEEGKDLFPDRSVWQQRQNFPAMRINTSTERNNCNQYDPISKNCSVWRDRPTTCQNFNCDWLQSELDTRY